MLGIKNEWQILRTGKLSDFVLIAAITLIFILVVALNVFLIFRMTSQQTEEIGQMQLESIRSELQGSIDDAEHMTLLVAARAEQMLAAGDSYETVKNFFYNEQREQKILSNGTCFNVYIANREWTIIPDFPNMPEDYRATERIWYKGAAENPGKVFVSEPYVDAAGHGLCFTVSLMLSDRKSVVALDFNFAKAQDSIKKMDTGLDRTALITTKDGLIIGHTNEHFIGEKVFKKLPQYEKVLEEVVNSTAHRSFDAEIDGRSSRIFSSQTDNGWYLILNIDSSSLYKEDYSQMILNSTINLWMIAVIVFYYFRSMKNRLQAIKALHAKEDFLSNLSKELRTPLQKILKASNLNAVGNEEKPTENAAKVREAALQLSDMLDNLFSFSTIMTERDRKINRRVNTVIKLSKESRTARQRIIFVLAVMLILRIAVSVDVNLGWGNTKMTREVESYENRLSNWTAEQKTILSMFANVISENPEFMSSYPDGVKFLNGIAQKYPDISACYLANPDNPHQIIMNNGWEPSNSDWRVDKRPWYIETKDFSKNDDEFTVSTPYVDARTGNYCVTFAKVVHAKNGEFLGVFAIDFYIDRLIKILSTSYTSDGYAFLVDKNGTIINHPNASYQMSPDNMTDIYATEYQEAYTKGEDFLLKDFRGNWLTCFAKKNQPSTFTVIVAKNWVNVYGQAIFFGGVFVAIYLLCIWLIVKLVDNLLKWQNAVQEKLKSAAKSALSAGQAKSQFLAQMSHEIRTPINAVLGMNEMILRETNDKDIREYAENVSGAGKTLLNLINSILDFSKIEDGKMEIISVRYDTLNLIDDLVNMIYEKANKKNLSFLTKIDPNLPKILFGDDLRVKQVITNLLTNAVKYTNQGTVTLTIIGEFIDDDSLMLYVSVKDTGIGIRQEDIKKLFESFIRLDETKNKNIEGTGLGISIVKELLTMMGSKLEVASVYGEGSEFSFKLRQRIIDKTPIGIYGEHHSDRIYKVVNEKFIRAPGARILAVDDTAMNLKVINGLLKRNLIVPDLADSGEKCLQFAEKYFYHIIFLDHMMPEMDGVETLKRLKKMKLPAETKVIALTANAISGARDRYISKGFDDYLSKPIDVNELEAILAKYLPPEVILDDAEETSPLAEAEKILESAQAKKSDDKACPSIDMEVALANCMDSEEFFHEMVAEYLKGDKTAELEKIFAAENWNEYKILVHALKSTSQVIGAVDLSEKARAQEFAARDGNIDFLKKNHADLMATYKKVRGELKARFAPEDKVCPSIDMEVALANCMDSEEFFHEMVAEYLKGDKTAELEKIFAAENWNEYKILVHALKSTSQVIGAVDLSEKARAQEFAARDGNIDFLKKNHADLMATYKKVRGELKARFAPEDKVCPSIDMEVALANCMDSEEFFHEMVAEYLKGDKTAELEKIFAAENWNEYKILVHALKSTSQVIGAVDLSEKARAQEFAARDGNIDFIKKNHADLMATYKKVREELSRWAGD